MSPIVVIVLVAAADAPLPSTSAVTTTVRTLRGSDSTFLVHEVESLPGDPDAEKMAVSLHANVVVEVRFLDPDRLHARVHVFTVRDHRWVDRDLEFTSADEPGERGRTIGIAIAALIPAPEGVQSVPEKPPVLPTVVPELRWAVSGGVAATSGIGGSAGGAGVGVAGEWWAYRALALRASAAFRFGSFAAASASSSTFALGAGVTYEALRTVSARPLAISFRLEALLLHESLTRTAFGETPATAGRFLPGADALIEAAWYPARQIGLVVASGFEGVLGTTQVFVDQERVGTLPRARWIFEAGVRLRF